MVSIDGDCASWGRTAQILWSDSVPIVVKSRCQPLYANSWIPWVHFVPVKQDLTDLVEHIQWCKDNDDKAQEIAKNGRSLYAKLYNLGNMSEDAASIYAKMA